MKTISDYLLGIALALCFLQLALTSQARSPRELAAKPAHEMLTQFEGQALRPVAQEPLDARFAKGSNAHLQRYASEDSQLLVRTVHTVSRSLHPAADCYRGMGYSLSEIQLHKREGLVWRCFIASKGERKERVCERIESLADASSYTDTSAWFWAAALGRSQGPWRALTLRQAA
jgi:hypothetical protein